MTEEAWREARLPVKDLAEAGLGKKGTEGECDHAKTYSLYRRASRPGRGFVPDAARCRECGELLERGLEPEQVAGTPCNGCRASEHVQCADWPGRLRCPGPCEKDESYLGPKFHWARQSRKKQGAT